MTKPNDPAYPNDIIYNDGTRSVRTGLTKLEYFAGKAMEALIARGALHLDTCSISAVAFAQALIAELNKDENGTD
jgi:Flp pilus assembly protein TadD